LADTNTNTRAIHYQQFNQQLADSTAEKRNSDSNSNQQSALQDIQKEYQLQKKMCLL
jgi:hypothetical protein